TNLTPLERAFIAASQRASRARTWRLRAAIAGTIGLAVAVYTVQRYHAANRLADAVDAQIAAARTDLDTAHAADVAARGLARNAFASFDNGDLDTGEAVWQRTLTRRGDAAREYREASRRIEAALAKDPTRDDVRDLLGDVLLERVALA